MLRPILFTLVLALALAPVGALRAQDALPSDPHVVTGKLDNGLTYFVRKNGKPENRAELRLVVDAGSILEDEKQLGLAHFLEHMAFNGTKNFEKQELVDYLQSIGMRFGADLNAYTSFDETVYSLQVPTEDEEILNKAFQILEDWAHQISFDPEEIEKERGVVLEEWRLGRTAMGRMRDKQLPVLFKGSRYAERLPIGEVEIIQNAPREEFLRFYKDWYRPDLMAVVAVGDFEPDAIIAQIKAHFGRIPKPENPPQRPQHPIAEHDETLFSIETDPEYPQSMLQIVYKHPAEISRTEADYRNDLVESLAQGMLNQRLQERAREAEPPFVFAYSGSTSFVRGSDAFMQGAVVRESDYEGGLTALLAEGARAKQFGFTASEFDRIKKNIIRAWERRYEERDKTESGALVGRYVNHFLTGEPMIDVADNLELTRKLLPEIALEEVNAAVDRRITEENRVVIAALPEKEGLEPPTRETLLAAIKKADNMELEPYKDEVSDAPLLGEPPAPGRVLISSYLEALDLYDWRLGNKVRVLFKPTDFKNDEVRFSAFSPGGTSLASDDDHIAATTATLLVDESGLGEFDAIELEKKLAGKVVGVTPYISELSEGLSGSASPKDLDTLFQLVYLTFTAPRADDRAFSSVANRYRELLSNRDKSPDTVFSDEVNKVLYQDHPRRQPFTEETLAKMDKDASLRLFKERFADAGGFTFVFVGNAEPERIKELSARYLGALPNLKGDETWRDVGVETVKGKKEVIVRKGLEPKSRVRMIYTGDAEWSPQNRFALNMLTSALRIRLREVLREDMGGVYGVGVSGSISRWPKERFSANVSFGCDPEKVEDLTKAVTDLLETVAKEGVEQSVIDKVKEMSLRRYEVNFKQNPFWTANLAYYYNHDLDPLEILNYPAKVEALENKTLRQAAQRYFSGENYVLAVLYPEKKAEGAAGEPSR